MNNEMVEFFKIQGTRVNRRRVTSPFSPPPHRRRDLLHPTEGVGITDADTRRQILKAVDALVD